MYFKTEARQTVLNIHNNTNHPLRPSFGQGQISGGSSNNTHGNHYGGYGQTVQVKGGLQRHTLSQVEQHSRV